MWKRFSNESYNLLRKVEHHYKFINGITMIQVSKSLIKKLSPPAIAKTERERYLAQIAKAHKITQFDFAIAIVILLDFVLTSINSVTKWWYVGFIDLFLSALLLILVISTRRLRTLLGRLLMSALVAGIFE